MREANRDFLASINWHCTNISWWYKEHRLLIHVEEVKCTKAADRNAWCMAYIHGTKVVEQSLPCNLKMFDVITLALASYDLHSLTCTCRFITQEVLKDSVSSIFNDYSAITCFVGNIYKRVIALSGHFENIIVVSQKWSCPTEFFFFTATQIIQDWLQC